MIKYKTNDRIKSSKIRTFYRNVYETFLIKSCNYIRLVHRRELLTRVGDNQWKLQYEGQGKLDL